MTRLLLVTALCLWGAALGVWAQATESDAPQASVRALRRVTSTSQARATVLATNGGWQPIYSQTIEAGQGDLLRLIGQTQLTLDSAPRVGQQLRLTVNGQPVGGQSIEINTTPGSHHLPMQVQALYSAASDGSLEVTLEGSSFHSDGNFPVTVDQADNLAYGSLLVEQYRLYPDLAAAWADGALMLNEVHQAPALVQDVWGLVPFAQEPLGSLVFTASAGDVLRPTAQAVAAGTLGLEQFSGVVTADGRAVSPYAGENVAPENPTATLMVEGYEQVAQDGRQFLEHRIYGAFGHGLTLLPDTARFEVAHFGNYGRQLQDFGQDRLSEAVLQANNEPVEVYSREMTLKEGDLLRLMGVLQMGEPPLGSTVACRLQLTVEGPGGVTSSSSQKTLTPLKTILPLSSFLTARAVVPGVYRISLKAWGTSDQGPIPLRYDSGNSHLQYMLFSKPG